MNEQEFAEKFDLAVVQRRRSNYNPELEARPAETWAITNTNEDIETEEFERLVAAYNEAKQSGRPVSVQIRGAYGYPVEFNLIIEQE